MGESTLEFAKRMSRLSAERNAQIGMLVRAITDAGATIKVRDYLLKEADPEPKRIKSLYLDLIHKLVSFSFSSDAVEK